MVAENKFVEVSVKGKNDFLKPALNLKLSFIVSLL
jgi:hypothetical protein